MADGLVLVVSLLLAAFVPPIIYMVVVRNTETCRREPWSALFRAFLYGATVAVLLSIILESLASVILYNDFSPLATGFWNFEPYDPVLSTIIMAVIVAPIVEEFVKSTGVPRRRLLEIEDGLVYGAAVGLGFAATENLLYLTSALLEGVEVFVTTAVLRSVTSTVLHASATAIAGYGIALALFMRPRGRQVSWLPYLGMAMLLHALFNLFASLGELVPLDPLLFALIGLALAFTLSTTAFVFMRRRIKELDATNTCG
ncbi:MAG: PrsW family intramembrane metalloprotease [Methanomassiliicoccales archaeon]|nr:PrsW family intramembrane metalloprotease [Methanomassiliicoccales archaeon]